ncbi:AraC family transcriptional regulator [Bacillus sp. JCM 19034]|uniref:AraC family transcriptional regulator n=1 Tax=Bacillus sp. JCM 19034 TaxID=1481928 RepID=UPI000784D5E7|nr:AraC family transcriptional regulator [Bacillus sp. JCM 19034]
MNQYIKASVEQPINFYSGGQFVASETWTHMKRNMDMFVLIINLNQTLYIEQNGKQFTVQPGEILFLIPGQLHVGFADSPIGTSYYWFHFTFSSPYSLLTRTMMDSEVKSLRSNMIPVDNETCATVLLPIHAKPIEAERIHILCKQLFDVTKANYYNTLHAHYLATSLLIEISEQTIYHHKTISLETAAERKVEMIKEWIRVHVFKKVTVSAVAEEFQYNSDYLSRIFKQTTGYSIQEYIHLMKISKAKELLMNTNETVKGIAITLGLTDEKYFMRLFKKYEKMTPTEFRKSVLPNADE